MKKITYIRCPRCELNYIDKDEKLCSVCKQEMQVGGGEDFDELDLELCPICKTNYIQPDEIMCSSCLAERTSDPNYDPNSADDWDAYINRDNEEELDDDNEDIDELSNVKGMGIDDDDTDDLDLDDDDIEGMSEDIVDDDEEDKSEEYADDDYDDYIDDDDDDYDDDDDDDMNDDEEDY